MKEILDEIDEELGEYEEEEVEEEEKIIDNESVETAKYTTHLSKPDDQITDEIFERLRDIYKRSKELEMHLQLLKKDNENIKKTLGIDALMFKRNVESFKETYSKYAKFFALDIAVYNVVSKMKNLTDLSIAQYYGIYNKLDKEVLSSFSKLISEVEMFIRDVSTYINLVQTAYEREKRRREEAEEELRRVVFV